MGLGSFCPFSIADTNQNNVFDPEIDEVSVDTDAFSKYPIRNRSLNADGPLTCSLVRTYGDFGGGPAPLRIEATNLKFKDFLRRYGVEEFENLPLNKLSFDVQSKLAEEASEAGDIGETKDLLQSARDSLLATDPEFVIRSEELISRGAEIYLFSRLRLAAAYSKRGCFFAAIQNTELAEFASRQYNLPWDETKTKTMLQGMEKKYLDPLYQEAESRVKDASREEVIQILQTAWRFSVDYHLIHDHGREQSILSQLKAREKHEQLHPPKPSSVF